MQVHGTIQWHDDKGWVTHDIEYEATLEIEKNYGCDADGNRGIKIAYISDYDYELPYSDMSDKDKAEIYELVEEHAAEQEPYNI